MPEYAFPVEATHILMFARAVGDTNPVYSDREYAATSAAGSIIAPPTFVQSCVQFDPEWFLRPRVGEPWLGSGREPTGLGPDAPTSSTNLLHAEQHFEYHRHPRPGDVLTVRTRPGRSWDKVGRKGGPLHFTETVIEYRDQDDELVITSRSVGVVTERAVESAGVRP